MIYISDHGETPSSKSWRTTTDKDLWEVPMIVWLSEEYKIARPDVWEALRAATDKPLQSDQLLAGFLHVAGIQGCGVRTPEDFLSPDFKLRYPRKIENGRRDYSPE